MVVYDNEEAAGVYISSTASDSAEMRAPTDAPA